MATYEPGRPLPAARSHRWQDWANLILAIWLFISPWVLSFGTSANPPPGGTVSPGVTGAVSNAAWNAWVLGVIVFLVAASALARVRPWQEWVNLLLGIWVFVAPWALGFVGMSNAAWDHWVVGALVFIVAVWDLNTLRTAALPASTAAVEPGYAGNKPNRRP